MAELEIEPFLRIAVRLTDGSVEYIDKADRPSVQPVQPVQQPIEENPELRVMVRTEDGYREHWSSNQVNIRKMLRDGAAVMAATIHPPYPHARRIRQNLDE